MEWLFVDDSKEDRDSFAHALSDGPDLVVRAISATEARELLARRKLASAGILMDIELSNESAGQESGLGLTADIRAAQHRGDAPSFPIVRFSYRAKVAQNIGQDSSSDEYFDLMIDKDQLEISRAQQKLVGVVAVYSAANKECGAANVFALDEDRWIIWGSLGFDEQLRVADRDYVKARLIVQTLVQPGILISEELVGIRLGIDRGSAGWPSLREALSSLKYSGVAAEHFVRWWARGLEMWWQERAPDPLAATMIARRHSVLSEEFPGLSPLVMPSDSPGDRPWRACVLTMEETGDFLPLDPARAVRFRPRLQMPEWVDPTYAALGPAIKHAEDPRLDKSDLARLKAFLRTSR